MSACCISTAQGALLYDPALVETPEVALFDAAVWAARGELLGSGGGRGSVAFVGSGDTRWVLRHYMRGGMVGRWIEDSFVFTGASRTRAFREWRLLHRLHATSLPVPRPVAAQYRRRGLLYRADLITERITGAEPLSGWLARGEPSAAEWQRIGRMLRRFHDAGVWHADLTAHNILLDGAGRAFLLDFDRGRFRRPGRWRMANLQRLLRSLRKIAPQVRAARYPDDQWRWLLEGYTASSRAHS